YLNIIDKAFEISINEEDEAFIAHVGSSIRKIDPSFDPRTYGFRNLTQLFESINKYEILKNVVNGLNQPLVKLKS
uniref:OST-HTH/LOTUS domain-containing protein n=1 Tax=Flavobacterium sp. TaxID=239 RepID=UPI002605071E